MQELITYKTMSCHISYLSYIYRANCYDESKSYDYLLAIQDMGLIKQWNLFQHVDFTSNPWNYQPYIIGDKEETENSLKQGVLEKVCNFYLDNFRINIEKITLSENTKSYLRKIDFDNNYFVIVNVDEKYISNSVYYKKNNNRHALLLKQVNQEGNYCVIDSEKSKEYWISADELEIAMSSQHASKNVYLINTKGFKLINSYNQYYDLLYELPYKIKDIDIYEFFRKKIYIEKDLNCRLFFLRSLILSLFFQIRPILLLVDRIEVINGSEERDFFSINDKLNKLSYLITMYEIKKKINIDLLDKLFNDLNVELIKLIRRY